MGSSPPDSIKKRNSKSPVQANASPPTVTDPVIADSKSNEVKPESSNAEPLAPPPRPAPAVGNTPDYFSVAHSGHLSYETNPFEHSFASGGTHGELRTPGGTKLPSVAALTSPSGVLGGTTPGFWGSLRSGPLSPAMLSGPQKDDYFSDGHHLRGGFPTPNESSMRSGLTPGGGGSMFPEPSPNSQAFGLLASGVATPSTLDFHRTALSAAAAQKREAPPPQQQHNITSQPQDLTNGMEVKPPAGPGQFDQHDANDAANGLFLLAQTSAARNGPQPTNHYTMAPQMPVQAHSHTMPMGGQPTDTSPVMRNQNQNSSISTASGRAVSEMSGMSEENNQPNKPNTRGKGKRSSTAANLTNGRRKADETPSKGPASKKAKANSGLAMSEPPSDEEPDMSKDEYNANGKKMTDEEKRKNFLERNRVAALKCRQRKKQWLANLQHKVEVFSSENDALNSQINSLRDEVVNLKTLLLAHKDCPISQQQGLAGLQMQQMMEQNSYGGQMNPYGMAGMHQQQQVMAGQGMQRRFS
ncbi:Transcription factor mts1 [Hyphodiscus hymeniophilus]|uniref:Transcription factor mts1 n=1 Tax=Hyphodiscus hymeniophilus TaxID=353542 RepID=A0A9P7B0C5_9HELO|nr:Transcription factor mts1 [Hyphodiscus hymeniophilus]